LRLIEALSILRQTPAESGPAPFRVHLACGFTPLDLKTFLAAHTIQCLQGRPVEVGTGLYGDLTGNLERLQTGSHDALAVVVEWADLDPRLGLRSAGGWRSSALNDIVHTAQQQLEGIRTQIARIAALVPVAICLPTLPLPPIAHTSREQADTLLSALRSAAEAAALAMIGIPGCRVVSRQQLDLESPPASRLDVRAELTTGFPYLREHADLLGRFLARLIAPPVPRKGLITDLDDTLWLGILGEVGPSGIGWTLEKHAQIHGLYQQFLQSIADAGVLVAVATKNDPALVRSTFQQSGFLVSPEVLAPIEAGWGPKSESVARILEAWNIAPDAVVFVDDSSLEIGEVQAAWPTMDCRQFLKHDPAAVWRLLLDLRDLFGRNSVSEEDRLRASSLRQRTGSQPAMPAGNGTSEEFLQHLEAVVSFDGSVIQPDGRALELINKTNQFNLNGQRVQEAEWQRFLQAPGTFLLVVSYQDRFGPLGRIAVLAGRQEQDCIRVSHWVMSCRAFSRRIEHACLARLFETTEADQLRFDYVPTPRNGPLRDFLTEIAGAAPEAELVLTRQHFREACPKLFHRVESA
jgi:FkbH-like protein